VTNVDMVLRGVYILLVDIARFGSKMGAICRTPESPKGLAPPGPRLGNKGLLISESDYPKYTP
jgi:hypothetical protein